MSDRRSGIVAAMRDFVAVRLGPPGFKQERLMDSEWVGMLIELQGEALTRLQERVDRPVVPLTYTDIVSETPIEGGHAGNR